jgi:hypothetical protein
MMNTWANLVTAFVNNGDCQVYSALGVALLASALVAYLCLMLVYRTVLATANLLACTVCALRARLPRRAWACTPTELWCRSWGRCTLEELVENIVMAVA